MEDKPIRVLLVEDNPGDFRPSFRRVLQRVKTNTFELEMAQLSLGRVGATFKEEMFDILLLDLDLPDSQGIDTFKKIHDSSPTDSDCRADRSR